MALANLADDRGSFSERVRRHQLQRAVRVNLWNE
jgi:hypothetical protein